ncbi:MAG: hypothetical protein GY932_02885 [Arcobacter sp.]|nr:hypothetical protein [Arcobacter sp.]
MSENYYWSDDLSNEFYIKAAQCGFITTSMYKDEKFFLLPEIQFDYAILDFDNIKISKKVKKLIKEENFNFTINQKFNEVLEKIQNYHEKSWLSNDYIKILQSIKKNNHSYENFELISVELDDKYTGDLISGEIGYKINNIYTSLSGFTSKNKKYNNYGKLQLTLLNYFLKKSGYNFWNLGHPQLQYKIDLGSRIYTREQFLERWNCNKLITDF